EPTSIPDTLSLMSRHGGEARLIAGGTWVTLVLKQGLLMPSAMISLRRVPGLDQLTYDPSTGLIIGALITHREMETANLIPTHSPILPGTFGGAANVPIRNQATVGGCLCDADYASDPPAMLTALGASVHLHSPSGDRHVPVADFIIGH